MKSIEQSGVITSRVAQSARALGALLLLGGGGHVLGVSAMSLRQGMPPRDRLSFLAFIAVAHWSAGALNLFAAAAMRSGDGFANAGLGVALGIIAGWAAIQLPAFIQHPTLISSGPLVYLVMQAALFAAALSRARAGSAQR
jgi:hypothetical protein